MLEKRLQEELQTDLPDLGPPQPIDHVYLFHGWTLTPDRPALYNNTARFVENGFGIGATGLYIPPCEFSPTLAFILSKMIMAVAPEDRYETTAEIRLDDAQITRQYMGRGLSFFTDQPPDMQ